MSALRGSGCFKALNTPVTLTIQPIDFCCLFIYTVLYAFRFFFFYLDSGGKLQQHFGKKEAFRKVKRVIW